MVSATDSSEEGFTALILGGRVWEPIWVFAIDSWALDKYDMPGTKKENGKRPLEVKLQYRRYFIDSV